MRYFQLKRIRGKQRNEDLLKRVSRWGNMSLSRPKHPEPKPWGNPVIFDAPKIMEFHQRISLATLWRRNLIGSYQHVETADPEATMNDAHPDRDIMSSTKCSVLNRTISVSRSKFRLHIESLHQPWSWCCLQGYSGRSKRILWCRSARYMIPDGRRKLRLNWLTYEDPRDYLAHFELHLKTRLSSLASDKRLCLVKLLH